ncbi:MAG: hypothetical protein KA781_01370 [Aquabacterium sp.]|nr:hypothetical protein [Aquabacterium sp.]MBP8190346.1 hypothetical protein [Aquabacterium sp.]
MTTWLIRAAIAAAVVAGIIFAYTNWRDSLIAEGDAQGAARVQAKWDKDKIERAAETLKAVAQARAQEQAHTQKVQEALNAANTRAKKSQAAAAAARRVADSLRDDLDTARANLPGASCASTRDYTSTLQAVFGECAREVERLAGSAQGHASDALTFEQAWPK